MPLHQRKCWDCGNIAEHTDNVTPEVLCSKCGSQDTRAIKVKTTTGPEDSVRVSHGQKWLNKTNLEDTIAFNQRARFTVSFIERWGAIAAIPDGEDSSGRQAFRMATPQELVTRATQTAEYLFAVLNANGWTVEVPEAVEEMIPDSESGITR